MVRWLALVMLALLSISGIEAHVNKPCASPPGISHVERQQPERQAPRLLPQAWHKFYEIRVFISCISASITSRWFATSLLEIWQIVSDKLSIASLSVAVACSFETEKDSFINKSAIANRRIFPANRASASVEIRTLLSFTMIRMANIKHKAVHTLSGAFAKYLCYNSPSHSTEMERRIQNGITNSLRS